MKKVKIISDSTCDLSKELIKKNNIENKVIGFVEAENFLLCQCLSSLLCFDSELNLIWEKEFGVGEKQLFFASKPVVTDNKIFLDSVNKKLLVLDLLSGDILKEIAVTGNLNFNYDIPIKDGIIYFPLSNGVIFLNSKTLQVNRRINFENPSSPLLTENGIFLSSYINKKIAYYDYQTNLKWEILFNNRVYSSPILLNSKIYVIDSSDKIYEITKTGKIINQITIESATIKKIFSFENSILYLNKEFNLMSFDTISKKVEKIIEVSNNISSDITIFEEELYWSNIDGELCRLSLRNQSFCRNKISEIGFDSSIIKKGMYYISGLINGDIIAFLEY